MILGKLSNTLYFHNKELNTSFSRTAHHQRRNESRLASCLLLLFSCKWKISLRVVVFHPLSVAGLRLLRSLVNISVSHFRVVRFWCRVRFHRFTFRGFALFCLNLDDFAALEFCKYKNCSTHFACLFYFFCSGRQISICNGFVF